MSRKRILRILGGVAIVVAVVGTSVTAFVTRDRWLPWSSSEAPTAKAEEQQAPVEDAKVLKLSPQARKKSLRALKSSVTTLSETLDRQVAFEEIQKAVQEGFQQAFSGMLSPGTWLAGEEVLRDDLIPTCQVQALEKVEPPVLK